VEETLLRRNLALISGVAQRADVEIILAFKGFAMWGVFPIVKEYIRGATASSLHEARLCAEEFGAKAHVYCPAIVPHEAHELFGLASHISFNSLTQYEMWGDKARSHGVSCGLRVNPGYSEVQTEMYNPCAPGSRLGISQEHLSNGLPEGIEGLHFHALCENDSHALERVLQAFEARFGHVLPKVKWVNMGGGHLMTRQGYDLDHLVGVLGGFKAKYPHLQVIMEPGSAFAWQTGYLVGTVLDVVLNHGISTAMMDVSFSAHMPDCLEMPYKPAIRGAVGPQPHTYNYRIGGTTCLSGDYMSEYAFEKPLQIGDRLVFEDMAHYTMVKTTFFNGVNHPSIGIWTKDDSFVPIRQFGYEDYRGKLS
jgi:carboxynorspermidine decarboxylase